MDAGSTSTAAWLMVSVTSGSPVADEIADPGAVVAPLMDKPAASPFDPFTQRFCKTTEGHVLGTDTSIGRTQSWSGGFVACKLDVDRRFTWPNWPLHPPMPPNRSEMFTA